MTPLTRMVSLITLPVAFLLSMSHLIGAEEGPGDGFTAGIISALALTLEYEVFDYSKGLHLFPQVRFLYVLLTGLVVALAAALLPLLAGEPLLAEIGFSADLPVVGGIKLSRGLLFDLGIYLAVVGGAMVALDSLRGRKA